MRKPFNLFVDDNTGLYCVAPALYDQMASMLRRLEWADESEPGPFCPVCQAPKWSVMGDVVDQRGHEPDCDLATLLRELP